MNLKNKMGESSGGISAFLASRLDWDMFGSPSHSYTMPVHLKKCNFLPFVASDVRATRIQKEKVCHVS